MIGDAREAVTSRLARTPTLLVLCEFDGTIAEFVTDPAAARPVTGALDALSTLGALPATRAAVISGRSLDSLRAVCECESESGSFELIGSGGMEIESQMTLGLTTDARRMRLLLVQAAGQVADAHPGVTVDEKPFGVALHVRGAESGDAEYALQHMLELTQSLPQPVYVHSRSEVLDLTVLPVGQDWAIDALREQTQATVLYAGNDESALAALTPADVGCAVGPAGTTATLHLDSPTDLVDLLRCVSQQRAQFLGRPS